MLIGSLPLVMKNTKWTQNAYPYTCLLMMTRSAEGGGGGHWWWNADLFSPGPEYLFWVGAAIFIFPMAIKSGFFFFFFPSWWCAFSLLQIRF
jgi:hypothetical protein